MTKPNEDRIDAAMLGDVDAAKECTEAGVVLPCLFCGSNANLQHIAWGLWQYCCATITCDATGPRGKSEAGALHAWNTRADLRHLAKPRWIPVAERMPEKYKSVLVRTCQGNNYLVITGKQGEWFYHGDEMENWLNFPNTVTHWMPLPEAAEEV